MLRIQFLSRCQPCPDGDMLTVVACFCPECFRRTGQQRRSPMLPTTQQLKIQPMVNPHRHRQASIESSTGRNPHIWCYYERPLGKWFCTAPGEQLRPYPDSVKEGISRWTSFTREPPWSRNGEVVGVSILLVTWFPLNKNKVTTSKHLSNVIHNSSRKLFKRLEPRSQII